MRDALGQPSSLMAGRHRFGGRRQQVRQTFRQRAIEVVDARLLHGSWGRWRRGFGAGGERLPWLLIGKAHVMWSYAEES
jgi:hypothetical protein